MDAIRIQKNINELLEQQRELERKLDQVRRNCNRVSGHQWGEVTFNPIYHPGYRIPSDKERGVELGVDSRGEYYVPSETIRRWVRVCKNCGTEQETKSLKTVHRGGSVAGTSVSEQVPDFGS